MGSCCDKPSKPEMKVMEPLAGVPTTEPAKGPEEEEEEEDDDMELDEPPPPQKNAGRGGARASVSAEAYGAWNQQKAFTPPVFPKTPEQKARITKELAKSWIFAGLEGAEMEQVISAFEEQKKVQGEVIIKEGDTTADCLYVIEAGNYSVWKKSSPTDPGNGNKVFTYQSEGVFGELALLYNCPRAATVIADNDGIMLKLDRETFNVLVKTSAQNKRRQTEEFLEKVPILETLSKNERASVCDAMKTRKYTPGEYIIKQGEAGNELFFLLQGSAQAIKDGTAVHSYKSAEYFGELALLRGDPRAADVKATSDVSALVLDRAAFKRLCGPLEGILQERAKAMYDKVTGA